MTYKMNGTELTIQPTVGRWTERLPVDIDGNGHPIYSPYHEFELRWQLVDMEQAQQLQSFFLLNQLQLEKALGSISLTRGDVPTIPPCSLALSPYHQSVSFFTKFLISSKESSVNGKTRR